MRISDWSSDVCSADLCARLRALPDWSRIAARTQAPVVAPAVKNGHSPVYRAEASVLETLLGFAGPVLAAASAGIAIVGNTWDPSKQGLKRLTLTGLCALLIAISRSEAPTSELKSLMRI